MRAPWFRVSLIGSLAVLAVCGMTSAPAQARVFVGLGFPLFFPPVVVAPPAYYPPYYAPPPGYPPPGSTFNYTPPGYTPRGYGPPPAGYSPSGGYTPSTGGGGAQSCSAGAYVCPLIEDTPPGGACTCPGHGGQRIRGQAD